MLTDPVRSGLPNAARIVDTMGQIRIHETFYAPHGVSLDLFRAPIVATTHAGSQSASRRG